MDADRYPRLTGVTLDPGRTRGDPLGRSAGRRRGPDRRRFRLDWQELKLDHIAATDLVEPGHPNDCLYGILTPHGTRIPGPGARGPTFPAKLPAAEKVLRLKRYLAENGSLEGRAGPQELNVRSLRSMATRASWYHASRRHGPTESSGLICRAVQGEQDTTALGR